MSIIVKSIVFEGPREIGLGESELPALGPCDVRIRTLFSGISRGTEMIFYRGEGPFHTTIRDPELMLHFDAREKKGVYPVQFGYENVGRIVEKGKEVRDLQEGDIVFTYTPHTTGFVVDTSRPGAFTGDLCPVLRLPGGLDPERGVFMALTGVAYNAILDARILLGETVAVFGLGVIGLLVIQLARMSGASQVVGIDPLKKRRELASKLGADTVIDPSKEDVALHVRNITGKRGADVCIEVSGSPRGLHEAIRTAGFQCRVVAASAYPGDSQGLFLGLEFHQNRIQIISSQAVGVNPELHPRWNMERKTLDALEVLPALKLAELITHRFPLSEAAKAYEMVDKHPAEALQVIFVYE